MSQHFSFLPKGSKRKFGIQTCPLDKGYLQFLQTSKTITVKQIQNLILLTIFPDGKISASSPVIDWEKVKVSTLKLSDRYFKYLEDTSLANFDGSIVFYCEIYVDFVGSMYILWPLMSEIFYLVSSDMVVLQDDKRPFYEQQIELGAKVKTYKKDGQSFVQILSFARTFQTSKRSLFRREISSVFAVRDTVEERVYKQNAQSSREIYSKTRQKEAMWLCYQDEVGFTRNLEKQPAK